MQFFYKKALNYRTYKKEKDMSNKYLDKILKIAGYRDDELEEDPALQYEEGDYIKPVEGQKENAVDFWGFVNKNHALARKVQELPDDIRDMFENIKPENFRKAKAIIVKNTPKDVMSFEDEVAMNAIREGLSKLIKVEKFPTPVPVPASPVAPTGEQLVAKRREAFKKIARARMNRISMLCGGESYKGNCKTCGSKFSYCKTGTPGEEQDAAENGYCSVACENKKK
jgi:hypothetical protein